MFQGSIASGPHKAKSDPVIGWQSLNCRFEEHCRYLPRSAALGIPALLV